MICKKDLLDIKSEILCWGVRHSEVAEEIYSLQHPTDHRRTGNAGIHTLLDDSIVLNIIYGEKFCETSPYSIEKAGEKVLLAKYGKPVANISMIRAPEWYSKKTSDGTTMADIVLQEGENTLIAGIWNNCCYFQKNLQCKFCTLGYRKGVEWKTVGQLAQTVAAAYEENPDYYLHLTGGNTFTPDHGIKYYEKYVKAVRAESDIPISIEISPPDDLKCIDDLVSAGACGFSINMEVWDEKRRKEICPGKSQIKRELYYAAWERTSELLGKFKASSVMIVGLDAPENIETGIKEMVAHNVKPVLIPYRPFGSALSGIGPPDPGVLGRLSEIAGAALKKAGAKTKEFVGCERCGACTLEKDFMKY